MAAALDRRESIGIGLAVLGHIVLFGVLTVGFLSTPNPRKLEATPIEISLTDEVGLKSEAPVVNREAPAERLAEVPAPPTLDTPPPVERPEPEPVVRPDPAPPKAQPQPAPKPEPKKAEPKSSAAPPKSPPRPTTKQVRPTGRLSGIVDGLTDQPSKGKATTPQAATIGPAVRSSVFGLIRKQVQPHWRSPTGADVNLLVTNVEVRLNRDGSLAAEPRIVGQTGETESNRPQQQLHKERAISAIKQAAPFKGLPDEYYDAWKGFVLSFDRRL
ncbi:cell envelope biogenesis protein TolA [Sphingomonas sp.]|uniref:cell envelope biogenesis protein TolA n=1 Tax=Sphingomonas sp. TaxID=28214 RepID=UPI001EC6EBEC|nr:cell envelope biogenesis protein TolA [Sphingomonas sp.]MBX3595699.1 cell envelope biogenesis protein TolA [Sphingomonas sp.]